MNQNGDFVVYSYAIAADNQACSSLNPTNLVQVIPAIINTNIQPIQILNNIQLHPPAEQLLVQQQIQNETSPYQPFPTESNALVSAPVPGSPRIIQTEFANDQNNLTFPTPHLDPTQPVRDKKPGKSPTKKAHARLNKVSKHKPQEPDSDLVNVTPNEVKSKVSGNKLKPCFIYECDICDSRFLSATSLKLHKTGHLYVTAEEKKAWICRFCGRHFSHQQTLGDHEKVHIDEVRYNCEACGAKYSSKSGLRNHLAKNEQCEASFRNRKLIRKKEEENEKQYGCDVCGKKYRHRKSMVEHRSLHYTSKQHKCERCGAMFETTGGWRKHRANGRCEFSKSKFKDSAAHPGGEDVYIPEDRKKFLEQIEQLESAKNMENQVDLPELNVNREQATDCKIVLNNYDRMDAETMEMKEESPCDDEFGAPTFGDSDEEITHSPKIETVNEGIDSESFAKNPLEENLKSKSPAKSRPMKTPQPKAHQCPTCNKIFARSFVLKNHMRTHTGERPFLCDTCSKSFIDMASLKGHLVTHTGEKPFSCSECPARFARKSGLRNHITVHFNLPCDECDQMFPSRKTLQRHKIKHKGIRPFLCDICSKDFQTKADMQAHLRIHSNEKRYACPICSARFNCPSTLRRHRNVHAPPETRPVCESCGKSFSSQQALRKHENIHKNLKPFQCDVCAKCFRVNDHLRIHQRSHSGERPFPCELCSKRFATNGDLRVHLRRHTGEKPYSCDECGEAFVVTAGLTRHMQQTGHQNNKPQAIIDPKVKRAT